MIKMNAHRRNLLHSYVFMMPLIIGLAVFYIFPLITSIVLVFSKVDSMVGFKMSWNGLDNIAYVFLNDVHFLPTLLEVVQQTLLKLPLTIVFSLLLAIMINKKIKFIGFFRLVFVLPFLLGTGYIMQQMLGQGVNDQTLQQAKSVFIPADVLAYLGPQISNAVNSFFAKIVQILWGTGVQILLFLSGLQGIPRYSYESAKMDGANEWEMFWKITLPMISPIMLLNIVYTLVSLFTDITNPLLAYIQSYAFDIFEFGYAAAMGWIYFIFILLVILLVFILLKNYIYATSATKDGGKNAL